MEERGDGMGGEDSGDRLEPVALYIMASVEWARNGGRKGEGGEERRSRR